MSASSAMECTVSIGSGILERMEQFLKTRILSGSRVFKEGMLLIRGKVDFYYIKQLAQKVARQIPGVEQVVNHLTVEKAQPTVELRYPAHAQKPTVLIRRRRWLRAAALQPDRPRSE